MILEYKLGKRTIRRTVTEVKLIPTIKEYPQLYISVKYGAPDVSLKDEQGREYYRGPEPVERVTISDPVKNKAKGVPASKICRALR